MRKKLDNDEKFPTLVCNNCNPKKYLKFNFSFCRDIGEGTINDYKQLIERIKFLSSDIYSIMIIKYQGKKAQFIEQIPLKEVRKDVPQEFRNIFPAETNEKYDVFRLYPSGTSKGSGNTRIVGMIKNTIFYVLFIDWTGKLYKHGR